MNKDFYNRLPGLVCVRLDDLEEQYGKEEWFEIVWEDYRQHILNTKNMLNMKVPEYFFNKYIKENKNDLE